MLVSYESIGVLESCLVLVSYESIVILSGVGVL